MKRIGSIISFGIFGAIAETLILLFSNYPMDVPKIALGFGFAIGLFVMYSFIIRYDNWVGAEFRSYAVRKQTSNRVMFAFVVSIALLPMNALVIPIDLARLAFLQMASVLITAIVFDYSRHLQKKYAYIFKNVKTKEVLHNGQKTELQ